MPQPQNGICRVCRSRLWRRPLRAINCSYDAAHAGTTCHRIAANSMRACIGTAELHNKCLPIRLDPLYSPKGPSYDQPSVHMLDGSKTKDVEKSTCMAPGFLGRGHSDKLELGHPKTDLVLCDSQRPISRPAPDTAMRWLSLPKQQHNRPLMLASLVDSSKPEGRSETAGRSGRTRGTISSRLFVLGAAKTSGHVSHYAHCPPIKSLHVLAAVTSYVKRSVGHNPLLVSLDCSRRGE